jgi:hypothetical protein
MSDYNNRQYHLMLEQLHDFETKRIDLKHLINGLESLLECLEKVAPDWRSNFQHHWGVLEDVYADALDRGYKELPETSNKLLVEAVRNLKIMVEDKHDGNQ